MSWIGPAPSASPPGPASTGQLPDAGRALGLAEHAMHPWGPLQLCNAPLRPHSLSRAPTHAVRPHPMRAFSLSRRSAGAHKLQRLPDAPSLPSWRAECAMRALRPD